MSEIVNHISDEQVKEAERIEEDPEKILFLVDLIFMSQDSKEIPS